MLLCSSSVAVWLRAVFPAVTASCVLPAAATVLPAAMLLTYCIAVWLCGPVSRWLWQPYCYTTIQLERLHSYYTLAVTPRLHAATQPHSHTAAHPTQPHSHTATQPHSHSHTTTQPHSNAVSQQHTCTRPHQNAAMQPLMP